MLRRTLVPIVALTPLAARLLAAQATLGNSGRSRISLAQWSLHKAIQSRLMANLQFPRIAREQFGIEGLEFVNTLMEPPIQHFLSQLKANMKATGTTGVLIMVDGEGDMGHPEREVRLRAADSHRKWLDAAAELGCHSIRTNMYPGQGNEPKTAEQVDGFLKSCAESFQRLCGHARERGLNVIIENHGGISSNPDVVARLMKLVNLPNFGTLPDFGNFPKEADKYDAVAKLMPFAKGVSFKCFDFDPASGRETTIDMDRMLKIVAGAGYRGWIGIEYEGSRLTEFEGIQAAKRYLDRALPA